MAVRPTPALEEPLTSSDAAIGASAMRKATLRLIPLIALGYGIMDSRQHQLRLTPDEPRLQRHHLRLRRWSLLSYAACEVPSNLLLYRFGARRWLARIMIHLGCSPSGCSSSELAQFYIVRFLLGMSEAASSLESSSKCSGSRLSCALAQSAASTSPCLSVLCSWDSSPARFSTSMDI